MIFNRIFACAALCIAASFFSFGSARAADGAAISVDASRAPEKLYRINETIAVSPGPLTLVYPKWIPGFHGPVGAIADVVNLHVSGAGGAIEWRRDLVDFYAIHVTVPATVHELSVTFDLATLSRGYDELVASSANLAVLQWSSLLYYPQGSRADDYSVAMKLKLPHGWDFGTALPVATREGDAVTFAPTSLTQLVDSPLNMGKYFRKIDLGQSGGKAHELDVAADSRAALDLLPEQIRGYKHLVAEGPALYGTQHYRSYHFLLTLSDAIAANGIEHHESSDNREAERFGVDESEFHSGLADLLGHEYSHSWNGKYRRPADLATPDLQVPEQTDLLWVYEGLNQYLGEVLTMRSGLSSLELARDEIALSAASLDEEGGRSWRSIRDVSDMAPILYTTPGAWYAVRRSAGDFYAEGSLIWLTADTIIRERSNGTKSLDDFCKLWAAGGSATPSVLPYNEADVIGLLDKVAPYDWAAFFRKNIAEVAPHAPLDGLEAAGWRLAYTDVPSTQFKAHEGHDKSVDLRFSLGLSVGTEGDKDGEVEDVLPQGLAARAGIAPKMKLIAVDGRKFSADVVHDALRAAKSSHAPIELLMQEGDFFSTHEVRAIEGSRYPHLVRIAGRADLLAKIYAPTTYTPPAATPHRSEE